MNYGSKIGAAIFPSAVHLSLRASLLAVPPLLASRRYRATIVSSTLKDSYDLISIGD
jgi:hypothetical protein